jgi:hypothetical protein
MESTARVRLPRPRNSVPSLSYSSIQQQHDMTSMMMRRSSAPVIAQQQHLMNQQQEMGRRTSSSSLFQRYTFPNITPPSVVQSQRRQQHSQQQQQLMRTYGDHPGLVTPVKPVYKLNCRHCSTTVCARGMKAILLADTTIELYSTDTPSQR